MTGVPGRAEGRLPEAWLAPALAVVLAVTLWRVAMLAFARIDLFVDESQYWLWSRSLDWGYYSKPPLIAWVIRAFTALGGDAAFWVRLPGPLFHGATALILGLAARRLGGGRAAFWTAALYATTPFAAMGSAMISTDTIMAPFFALALLFWLRLTDSRRARDAVLAGAAVGVAMLAKYAGVYALLGMALAAITLQGRIGWRNAAIVVVTALAVLSPNLIWNAHHGFVTLGHTADNIAGAGGDDDAPARAGLNPRGAIEFVLAQFIVFGPILFGALLAGLRRTGPARPLILWSLPIVALVTLQALLSRAYANWAIAAYFAGTVAAVLILANRPLLLRLSLAFGVAVTLALPLLAAFPTLRLGDKPLLHRYIGRASLSAEAIQLAKFQGATTIVSDSREVLADLFYTGRDSGLDFRAVPPDGRPLSYYQETFALTDEATGPVLAILSAAPQCNGMAAPAIRRFDTSGGAYWNRNLAAYLVGPDCLRPPA